MNTDWTIHILSCEEPCAKVAQLEEKLEDMEKQKKALHKQVTSMANQTTFGVHLIKDNDEKSRFYTGLPVYGVFVALLTYLQTKAVKLREWRGEHETSAEFSSRGQKPWATIPVAEQFFLCSCPLATWPSWTRHCGSVYQKEHFLNYLAPG